MKQIVLVIAVALLLPACSKEQPKKVEIRPVRVTLVQHALSGDTISLTGQIQAKDQINLAFRIGGRLQERNVTVGDPVTPGQIVARIEPQDFQNALRSAEADLASAQAVLANAQATEGRQSELLSKGFATRVQYDQAEQGLKTAQAQVESAQAKLQNARDNLAYTDLKSDVAGSVTAKGAEPGEVVAAGRMVLQVARQGGRDAVFNVPSQLIRRSPKNPEVTVALSDDPGVIATGHVREVAPQADAATGTYVVKVGLDNPPDIMRLGATIIGRVRIQSESVIQLPGTALTQSEGKPAVWVVDPNKKTVSLLPVIVDHYDTSSIVVTDGLSDGDIVVTAGVQVVWPGANITDTLEQITDRVEKKLQETPGLDYIRSYTVAGTSTVFITLKGSVQSRDVPDVWYQVRKKIGDIRQTLPQGIVGPFFNDEFGDTYGIIYAFTADGFTQRELRDYVESARTRLLAINDVSKIDIFGAQDEKIYVEFSSHKLAGLRLDRQALIQAIQAQNAVTPAGVVQTSDEKIRVDVTGGFRSETDLRNVNLVANGQIFRLSDIATVKRTYSDPPQPMFRINGQAAIGIGISMRAGGDVLALGQNVERAMSEIRADLPIGIEPHLAADQPKVVKAAVDDFMEALLEAIGIVLAVSFISLGIRAGAVVACSIPLVLAAVFVGMELAGIDLQRVSLGARIIALGLLVDDAMITVEIMVTQLEAGAEKAKAATFAYTSTAFPMLTGTLVTVAGFVPIGFAKSAAGEYTFSLFAVVALALLLSWIVAVLFAPLIGVTILPDKVKHEADAEPGRIMRGFRRALTGAMRAKWLTIGLTLVALAASIFGMRFVPQQFFPASDRPELLVDLKLSEASSLYATVKVVAAFEELLKGDPDIH